MILLCRYNEIHNISGLLPFMRISLGKFRFLFQQSFQNKIMITIAEKLWKKNQQS